jgi:hypothetical protein
MVGDGGLRMFISLIPLPHFFRPMRDAGLHLPLRPLGVGSFEMRKIAWYIV